MTRDSLESAIAYSVVSGEREDRIVGIELTDIAESYAAAKVREALERARETARRRNEAKESRGFRSMMEYFDQEIAILHNGLDHGK